MIITIKGANFSTNNIGTLTTWIISKTLGAGATYEGPDFVDRGAALNATVTVAEGYEILGTPSVSMGGVALGSGVTVSGNVVTIAIGEVTGNVAINVATKSTAAEPETPSTYTITYVYVDGSGAIVKASTTETVAAGTVKNFATTDSRATVDGYTCNSVSPTSVTVNGNITVTYIYTANSGAGDGDTGDSGNNGAVRLVFSEVDNYQSGFVNKRSVLQASDSHYHCSIPAANVQSVTITPLMVQEDSTTVWYVTYKSDAGATQWWGCLAEITPNEPITIDFSEMTDGTIYFNDFYDKNGVLQYPRYADIVYV